jgi:hypothetical protein
MKKLILLSIVAVFLYSCADTKDKKYEIKSASIKYKNSMMGTETTKMVYFKEYGDIEATTSDMAFMGMKGKQVSLQKEGFLYIFLEGEKEGMKMKMEDSIVKSQILNEENITKEHGKKTVTEKVLGKECTVYEINEGGVPTKIWIWKKLPLKVTYSQQGVEVVMEAVELNESPDFPQGIFDLPSTVTFKDLSNQMPNTMPEENIELNDSLDFDAIEDTTAKG